MYINTKFKVSFRAIIRIMVTYKVSIRFTVRLKVLSTRLTSGIYMHLYVEM